MFFPVITDAVFAASAANDTDKTSGIIIALIVALIFEC
jgi:hypothetical protein